MTQTEAIRTIAEYDGWEFYHHTGDRMLLCRNNCTRWLDTFDYATNIASLYFVAGRVVNELLNHITLATHDTINAAIIKIKTALLTFSPDLTPLLMAVADGVELIKTYKIN